jgi:hypothetical protein
VPFTTGILIDIGETRADHANAICAPRKVASAYNGMGDIIRGRTQATAMTTPKVTPNLYSLEINAKASGPQ